MNMNKWITSILRGECKKSMPILSYPGAALIGVSVGELVKSGDYQARAMKAVADRCDMAASVSLMDLSVEAECFGANIRFSETEIPAVTGILVDSAEKAEALSVPKVGCGRSGIYIDAIKKAKELIIDRPVFAGVIGPFSLAARLCGVTEIMMLCYDEPETVECVLGKATEFLINYIKEYKNAGADGIVMAEPVTGLLSLSMEKEFSAEYVGKIVGEAQDENFTAIYHNCGKGVVQMTDSIFGNGCRAYHFGNAVGLSDMLRAAPDDKIVMGNIDPVSQFRNGTPETMRASVGKLISECGGYKNFLLSSGCDIPPATPWENIDAFFSAACRK